MAIVRASIDPILAERIRLPEPREIHCVSIEQHQPLRVAQRSLDFAAGVAQRIIDGMHNLPVTPEAGEMLALAYAVLHYSDASGKIEP